MPERITPAQRMWWTFKRNKTALVGAVGVCIIFVLAAVGPFFMPYDPVEQHLMDQLKPPSRQYLFGTDVFGRDVLSRVVLGARFSLMVGLSSVMIAVVLGVPLGIIAGYKGGTIDTVITRVVDILMSFPVLILGLMIRAAIGGGLTGLVLAIGISITPRFIRLARGPTISIREKEYVEAAKAMGVNEFRLMFRHILPNVISDVAVMSTLWIALAIRLEANLSFIGIGIPPPTPSWGEMIRSGVDFLVNAPWISFIPGMFILFTVMSFNMIGDGIRDIIDPRLD
ncbi:MAG: ABC transporter permease [Nitrospinota bacterium]|nr:MAG: ABC transporter permease [Nitrospinota bacterium]